MKVSARILLGLAFAVSSVAKLSALESFELYIFSFGYAGFDLCSVAARLIIIAEFLLGAFLVLNILPRMSRWLTAISLGGFSAFLLWRAFSGDSESCHCMGDLVDLNPVQSLIKNAVLAIILAFVWKTEGNAMRHQVYAAAALTVISSSVTFLAFPPDFYYRYSSESDDLSEEAFSPVADSLGLSSGKRIVCFYSGSCGHCRHCASKMAGIISRHSIPEDSVFVLFMQTHENQDSVATSFFHESGEDNVLPYDYLHPIEFIPLTNGSMPLVVLFDDGEMVKEYDYLSIDEKELAAFFSDQSH